MAKLRNKLPHMAGQSVNVDGQRFQIDADGFAEIEDKSAVDKLLQNKAAWSLEVSETKVEPTKTEEPKVTPPVVRKPVVEKEKAEIKETKKPVAVPDDSADEWPDPTPSMSISYLRQMANAYPSVNYTIKTSKAELIKRINAAMYDEEE